MLSYVLPAWKAVDIDTEEDLVLAEILLRGIAAGEAAGQGGVTYRCAQSP